MNYNVVPTEKFKKEAKRLIKKYPSLKSELHNLSKLLSTHPDSGTPLGHNSFKIRIAIASKNKGKSGGARVITYMITENEEVYLLTIYDKSEISSLDSKNIKAIIESIKSSN